MKKLISLIVVLFLSVFGVAATAEPSLAPEKLVMDVSTQVLDEIKKDPALAAADPAHVNQLVDKKILPYTDFATMTRMAVGPSWRKANEAQRKELMQLFRTLLVAVYSGALKEANNYTVEPAKSRPSNDPRLTIVRTRLVASQRDPIQLDYRLMNTGKDWKIFDVCVGGVWLVENYRSQFASVIGNSGLTGLIAQLKDRVQKLEANKGK